MKPILFNTDMVRAVLNSRKTMTRRVIKPQPKDPKRHEIGWVNWVDGDGHKMRPPYQPGDILYVRETWSMISEWTDVDPSVGMFDEYIYKADWSGNSHPRWHPSIHMPREAARIFLRVTDVRVERLQDITEEQAVKEGALASSDLVIGGRFGFENDHGGWTAIEDFSEIWNSTIKPKDRDKYGWDANPWVWVISFERIKKPEATP